MISHVSICSANLQEGGTFVARDRIQEADWSVQWTTGSYCFGFPHLFLLGLNLLVVDFSSPAFRPYVVESCCLLLQ